MAACKGGRGDSANAQGGTVRSDSAALTLSYAKGFSVKQFDGYKLLTVKDPQGESSTEFKFILRDSACKASLPKDLPIIDLPLRRVICMTALQLSAFIKLGNVCDVCGISSVRHLFNQEVKNGISDGSIKQIGIEGNFDAEVIMSISPDVIFTSPFKRGGTGVLEDIAINSIPYLGYKETTPLGQAEWIKFIGLLTGRLLLADSIFTDMESKYNRVKEMVALNVQKRPTVFSGEPRGGVWYAVGGESFLANLFKDAGADYFLKNDSRSGGVNLDFEQVYGMAGDVDYWRIVNSYDGEFSYDALTAQDSRYSDFKAVKDKGVIYCNMRERPFYETSPMTPEIILQDMVKVFHPNLLPDYDPYFYKLLR